MVELKEYLGNRKKNKFKLKYNYRHNNHFKSMIQYYSDHPYYHHLSYALETFANLDNPGLANRYLEATHKSHKESLGLDELKKRSLRGNELQQAATAVYETIQDHASNTVTLFNTKFITDEMDVDFKDTQAIAKNLLVNRKLFVMTNGESQLYSYQKIDLPIYPRKESQYIVDYSNQKLYYFNIFYSGEYRHFEFDFAHGGEKLYATVEAQKSSPVSAEGLNGDNAPSIKGFIGNAGLCLGDNKIFWVYGQTRDQSIIGPHLRYYDIAMKKWIKLTVKTTTATAMSRHSVACSYMYKDGKHILFVFGGNSCDKRPDLSQEVINIVEYYDLNFKCAEAIHCSVPKGKFRKAPGLYMPYLNSYCLPFEDQLMILGGMKYTSGGSEGQGVPLFLYE